ncbi:MAG: SH3 domain-containing protein [Chloroflexota bacterium]
MITKTFWVLTLLLITLILLTGRSNANEHDGLLISTSPLNTIAQSDNTESNGDASTETPNEGVFPFSFGTWLNDPESTESASATIDEAEEESNEVDVVESTIVPQQQIDDGDGDSDEVDSETTDQKSYQLVTDDTGTITLDLPSEWRDISNGDWLEDGEVTGIYISAAPDLDAYFDAWYSTWDTPGIFFGYSEKLVNQEDAVENWLDDIDLSDACDYEGRSALSQPNLMGAFDVWANCGNTESVVLVVAAMPVSESYLFVIETLSVSREDLLAIDHLLATFAINLPGQPALDIPATSAAEAIEIPEDSSADSPQINSKIEPTGDEIAVDPVAEVKSLVDTSGMTYQYELMTSETINALLPITWSDSTVEEWDLNGEVVGLSQVNSTDVNQFGNAWGTAGVWSRTSTVLGAEVTPDEVLDLFNSSEACVYDNRYEHTHQVFGVPYESKYDLWTQCGGTESILAIVAAESPTHFALIEFQTLTNADAEAFGVFLNTFFIGDINELAQASNVQSADNEASEADLNQQGFVQEGETSQGGQFNDENASQEEETGPVDGDSDGNSANDVVSTDASEETETALTFTNLVDDTGSLSVTVPSTWTDVESSDWIVNGEKYGRSLSASPNLTAYDAGWDTPGVFMGVSDELALLEIEQFLAFFVFEENCAYDERYDYDDSVYVGAYDIWKNCGDNDSDFLVLAAKPVNEPAPLIMLNVLVDTRSSIEVAQTILDTFNHKAAQAEEPVLLAENSSTESSDTISSEAANDLVNDSEPDIDIAVISVDELDSETDSDTETVNSESDPFVPSVTVLADALNIRSGPGVSYPLVSAAFKDDTLKVNGKTANCAWFQVTTSASQIGWVSGGAAYVSLDGDCASIVEIGSQENSGAVADGASEDDSTGVAAELPPPIDIAEQGCYLFQNQIGVEITITLSRGTDGWNVTFILVPEEEQEQCLIPGGYTYVLDAPPPWGSISGELVVNSGDRYYFPIRAE